MIKNNDHARQLIAEKGITSDNVTHDQLLQLHRLIDQEMKNSGSYNGKYGMNPTVNKYMTCHSDRWNEREAVSFNPDGFIGFAGWADSKNTRPILDAVEKWLDATTLKAESAVYYRAKLVPDEDGLSVVYEKWYSIHESEQIHFCLSGWDKHMYDLRAQSIEQKSPLKKAKELGLKVKRIYKNGSRFAQSSHEKALANLRYRKSRQAMHMRRESGFIDSFLNITKDCSAAANKASLDLRSCTHDQYVLPETKTLVNSHLTFY